MLIASRRPLYTPTLEVALGQELWSKGMSKDALLSWLMGQHYDMANALAVFTNSEMESRPNMYAHGLGVKRAFRTVSRYAERIALASRGSRVTRYKVLVLLI